MEDQDYTLNVLKMAINTDLDSSIGTSMSDLAALDSSRDQLVWEVATRIYTHSGHKLELSMVRDLVEARIIEIENQFVQQQHLRVRQHPPRKVQRGGISKKRMASTRLIFLKICAVICECTNVSANRIIMSSKIYDLAKRHEVAKILTNLEEIFDVEISEKMVIKLQTVENIADFISGALKAGAKRAVSMSVARHNRHQASNDALPIG